jgi:hypothetical protein
MSRVRHYAEILNDLFDPRPHMKVERFFEFVCTLVRAGGIHGPGWDPWLESKAVIDDLQNLSDLTLPADKFPDIERTQARERCLRSFTDFKNRFSPYDLHYKGLLELVFGGEDKLIGFRVYWPNSHLSEFVRKDEGCDGRNLEFDPDGSINFFVGIYASKPGTFSPLVEHDAQPKYPERPGASVCPYWPEPLASYKLL